jgi:hypothetical protein
MEVCRALLTSNPCVRATLVAWAQSTVRDVCVAAIFTKAGVHAAIVYIGPLGPGIPVHRANRSRILI